jgi:hypothetical protein
MKSKVVFYIAIAAPMLVLYFFLENLTSEQVFVLLFTYAFLYRPVVDYARLKALHCLDPKNWWKVFLPFGRIRYAKELYG